MSASPMSSGPAGSRAAAAAAPLDPVASARIRRRYPRSRMRGPLGLLLALVLAAILLTWTIWAGLQNANRPVDAQVHSFRATSDNLLHVTLDIQRSDTSKGASCTVFAAGDNGVAVGEATASVAAGGTKMSSASVDIRTTGRGLSAKVGTCTVG